MKFNIDIETTIKELLAQEDTDGDKRITVEDKGPMSFSISDIETNECLAINGTYYLSNLLQELILAKEENRNTIQKEYIFEKPVDRLKRMIETYYWDGLTRTIDKKGLLKVLSDDKSSSKKQRMYVPFNHEKAFDYFKELGKNIANFEVIQLPKEITPTYVQSINDQPGILSLKLYEKNGSTEGVPFVVPGGRFNEMYGWDSYFEAVGILLGQKSTLAKNMADNFQYEIEHYGKILNANRTYYLTRTQPPFYSSLIREVFENRTINTTIDWLKSNLKTALKEYFTVWMVDGKRLSSSGLNRYLAEGIGMPPETEAGHFNAILKPFAEKAGLSISEYEQQYYHRKIKDEELDAYFVHDRSVRESGHDTSYRLEDRCANLNTVDLNTFLYKYEIDFAYLIKTYFNDSFSCDFGNFTSSYWETKAQQRKNLMHQYLWNESDGCYYDYDIVEKRQILFTSATSLLPLWAGIATETQAKELIENILPQLTFLGGIAGCTETSRGEISEDRPARQWDYPNGWAPHQMMIWKGLLHYNYTEKAYELIYRWLWMITKNAVDYNGTIPEKYDVVSATHKVFAEYGNVGTDFEYITKEGFGWMNASYIYGLYLLPNKWIEKLNNLEHPDSLF
ncbi:MAG: trehalase [Flavobacteriaceae bacterium]|nr:trehalase [Flavobacteriaceae bacterium]